MRNARKDLDPALRFVSSTGIAGFAREFFPMDCKDASRRAKKQSYQIATLAGWQAIRPMNDLCEMGQPVPRREMSSFYWLPRTVCPDTSSLFTDGHQTAIPLTPLFFPSLSQGPWVDVGSREGVGVGGGGRAAVSSISLPILVGPMASSHEL